MRPAKISVILKRVRCPTCGKKFHSETNVLQHMNQPNGSCGSSRWLELGGTVTNYCTHPQANSSLASSSLPLEERGRAHDMDIEESEAPLLPPNLLPSTSPPSRSESREQEHEYGLDDVSVPMLPFDEPLSDGDARELGVRGDGGPLAGRRQDIPFTELFAAAGKAFPGGKTFMDAFWEDEYSTMRTENIFYPFASRNDWQFASWLTRSGLSMASIDTLLSLEFVRISIAG
jgi:hypothetical protein